MSYTPYEWKPNRIPGIPHSRLNALEQAVAVISSEGGEAFRPGTKVNSFASYWYPDHWDKEGNWHRMLKYGSDLGFVVLNMNSGIWDTEAAEANDFRAGADLVTAAGATGLIYVRTAFGYWYDTLASGAADYPLDEKHSKLSGKARFDQFSVEGIIGYLKKGIETVGASNVKGVFLDEMINGWGDQEKRYPFYKELYDALRKEFGESFRIIGNPGSNTPEFMLDCADVLMTFESTATKYLDDEENGGPVHPDHYRKYPGNRFWHIVHDVTTENYKQVFTRAEDFGVTHLHISDLTFAIGGGDIHNPEANPYQSPPSDWIRDLSISWTRGYLGNQLELLDLKARVEALEAR